jgi:hypothetical protein
MSLSTFSTSLVVRFSRFLPEGKDLPGEQLVGLFGLWQVDWASAEVFRGANDDTSQAEKRSLAHEAIGQKRRKEVLLVATVWN